MLVSSRSRRVLGSGNFALNSRFVFFESIRRDDGPNCLCRLPAHNSPERVLPVRPTIAVSFEMFLSVCYHFSRWCFAGACISARLQGPVRGKSVNSFRRCGVRSACVCFFIVSLLGPWHFSCAVGARKAKRMVSFWMWVHT